mmetsp:Transcript_58316/g.125306  ORF Transcript_58316/g.125306 Transcript_58316/m.125306 type:complete len:237 (-) Transcript_58316:616-1326(-)
MRSPGTPVRLKLPDTANFSKILFSRRSISCCRLATRHRDATFSALASCFVASASQIICSSCQEPCMIAASSSRSALTFNALAFASASETALTRQVSSSVFVRLSCVVTCRIWASACACASMRATRPSSSAFTLRCSNSSSARLLRPLSETRTCSLFRLISSIVISDSCLICMISNSFCRLILSIALSIFVVFSRHSARESGNHTAVIFTSVKVTPHSLNLSFKSFNIVSAFSLRKL